LWRDWSAPESGLPSDRHPDRTERAVVLEAVKVMAWQGRSMSKGWCNGQPWQLLRATAWRCCGSGRRNGLSDRTKKLTKDKNTRCTAEPLTKEAPYKESLDGFGVVLPSHSLHHGDDFTGVRIYNSDQLFDGEITVSL
jgi:hypothetical protein